MDSPCVSHLNSSFRATYLAVLNDTDSPVVAVGFPARIFHKKVAVGSCETGGGPYRDDS